MAADPLAIIKTKIEQLDCQISQNGGLNCGWDAPDHKDFLRVRTKHNGRATFAFINEMKRALPLMDEVAVNEHLNSYQLYLDYCDKKRDLVAKYKEMKEN